MKRAAVITAAGVSAIGLAATLANLRGRGQKQEERKLPISSEEASVEPWELPISTEEVAVREPRPKKPWSKPSPVLRPAAAAEALDQKRHPVITVLTPADITEFAAEKALSIARQVRSGGPTCSLSMTLKDNERAFAWLSDAIGVAKADCSGYVILTLFLQCFRGFFDELHRRHPKMRKYQELLASGGATPSDFPRKYVPKGERRFEYDSIGVTGTGNNCSHTPHPSDSIAFAKGKEWVILHESVSRRIDLIDVTDHLDLKNGMILHIGIAFNYPHIFARPIDGGEWVCISRFSSPEAAFSDLLVVSRQMRDGVSGFLLLNATYVGSPHSKGYREHRHTVKRDCEFSARVVLVTSGEIPLLSNGMRH
jgi:hypothetical protein